MSRPRSKWMRKRMSELHKLLGGRCGYCGAKVCERRTLDWRGPGVFNPSLDHVIPVSVGGQTVPENLMLCCVNCNSTKGRDTLDRFRDRLRDMKNYQGKEVFVDFYYLSVAPDLISVPRA
jgi:5-methylcytosine-specific restriction endonuclease McrA